MRGDTLTQKMRDLAVEKGWREMIRVSRRVGRPGVGSQLWRPWGLFDYMAFHESGVPIGLRVQRITASLRDSRGSLRDRDEFYRLIQKRIRADKRKFERDLGEHPWRLNNLTVLVLWTKTRKGNNYRLWWEPSVFWF